MPAPSITKSFSLGEIVATRGALDALNRAGQPPLLFVLRHLRGDWGEVGPEDWQANDEAVEHGDRLLSAYRTAKGDRLWIVTEWDRSVTTLLQPDEY
jgi:hypothetical protein